LPQQQERGENLACTQTPICFIFCLKYKIITTLKLGSKLIYSQVCFHMLPVLLHIRELKIRFVKCRFRGF